MGIMICQILNLKVKSKFIFAKQKTEKFNFLFVTYNYEFAEYLSDISLNYFSLLRRLSSKYDLTLSQSLLLLYVPYDGISVSDLSEKLGVDISTMTRNIQRIDKQGLIKRKPNENDKRSIKLFLSKEVKS